MSESMSASPRKCKANARSQSLASTRNRSTARAPYWRPASTSPSSRQTRPRNINANAAPPRSPTCWPVRGPEQGVTAQPQRRPATPQAGPLSARLSRGRESLSVVRTGDSGQLLATLAKVSVHPPETPEAPRQHRALHPGQTPMTTPARRAHCRAHTPGARATLAVAPQSGAGQRHAQARYTTASAARRSNAVSPSSSSLTAAYWRIVSSSR